MPSYFYHLRFELYPTNDPTATGAAADTDVWLPPAHTSVFDDLPAHPPPIHDLESSNTEDTRREKTQDWRFGHVSIETIDPIAAMKVTKAQAAPSLGPPISGPGTATKATCLRLQTHHTNIGWGVVHFYRDDQESTALRLAEAATATATATAAGGNVEKEEDCSTLCIPAVPAYMSPGDLWGFMGERWRDDISHCRMVKTSQRNRYLVLLKFRHGKVAREWKKTFDGTVFNTMEPQVCHVVFVKSITFDTPTPKTTHGPMASSSSSSAAVVSNTLKPFPPPTPNLVELPTCPVCLERMDETSGIMTIPCAHVFHCTCLQSWKGGGCPVCRCSITTTQGTGGSDEADAFRQPFGSDVSNLCSICDSAEDLWICLICGYVGCGRYKGGHAKDHWKKTAHNFALELETQHVWDYVGDVWVHRLIRDKGDGKVVELPGRSGGRGAVSQSLSETSEEEEDMVPRTKLDNIGFEYTHLITSQLESQRAYYEEMLSKSASKASKASAVAEKTAQQAAERLEQYKTLDEKFQSLSVQTVPHLERDLERERTKATKSEKLARNLSKSLQEEKKVNEGLMKRIEHISADAAETKKQLAALKEEMAELKEMNRDLSMFISGQEKLKEMEKQGQIEGGELEGGSASVPEKKKTRPRRTG